MQLILKSQDKTTCSCSHNNNHKTKINKAMETNKQLNANVKKSFDKSDDQKLQLIDFLKKYSCIIYVKIALNVNFKSLHSNKLEVSGL